MPEPSPSDVLGDSLIPVINKLQDIFSQVTLDFKLALPQVAVVGSQSSGKSSVLEALVGRDFLPRGPDICTRRPLVLQLVKVPPPKAKGQPAAWGEFLHAPGKILTDFMAIRAEIQHETDRVSGSNKNISDKPIRLKICSPHVLTMTLIDLPGITKVPVGDQPSNIEQRIREMIFTYIREPSCIILAVSASNTDLANSDALQMAQLVDAEGVRTIGVLTKLDIMDRGTNAVNVLKNRVVPLRLGYVAVVNRSQADINANTPMDAARKAESAWFEHHPEYSDVVAQCGVGNLARRLNTILGQHIRSLLPGLKKQVSDALDARSAELKTYGEALDLDSDGARGAALLQLLCKYAERYSALLEGRSEDMPLSELMGGARIRHIFLEMFGRNVTALDPLRELGDEDVRTAIKNSSGVAGTLLIPQEPFELLVRRSIRKLEAPGLTCLQLVYDELLKIAEAAAPPELARFPVLQRRLAAAVLEFIQQGAQPAERFIRDLVECEQGYINTDNPAFIGGTRAVKEVMEDREARRQAAAAAGAGAAGEAGRGGKGSGEARQEPLRHAKSQGAVGAGGGVGAGPGGGALVVRGGPTWAPDSGGLGLKGLHESSSAPEDVFLSGRGRDDSNSLTSTSSSMAHRGEPSGTDKHGWFSWFKGDSSKVTSLDSPGGGMDGLGSSSSRSGKPRSEHEEVQVEVIRRLVSSYFDLVRATLVDLVPKALMRFMVQHSQRGMQQHLIATLYRVHLASELLTEREDVAKARARCRSAVEALTAAMATLEEVPSELTTSLAAAGASSADLAAAALGQAGGGGSGFGGFMPQPERHPLNAADRHPSMHMAAQIASATTLMVPVGNSSSSKLPSVVDSEGELVINGTGVVKSVQITVDETD